VGREKREGLVARQSGLLKASPGCLHINEQPIFSTRVGAPTHCISSRPPMSAGPAWLSTAQWRSWGLWKEQSCGHHPHSRTVPRVHSALTVQPPRALLGTRDKCQLSDLRDVSMGEEGLGAQIGSYTEQALFKEEPRAPHNH
jgi:hypothetical protein